MKKVNIFRIKQDDIQTLGVLTAVDDKEIFVCRTLELPWKKNMMGISCIPEGDYICTWSYSEYISDLKGIDTYTYEVLSVIGRSGIRIHSANYFSQLKGCIALGDSHKDINLDGNLDVIHSGATVDYFNNLMGHEDFILSIRTINGV